MATTKITNPELFDLGSLNTALKLPSGTTAERPASPSTGEWRYNTTTNLVEYYDGGAWRDLQSEDIPPIPSENFDVTTYTGNGSTQSITGVGFQPDFTWIKKYNASGTFHMLTTTRIGTGEQFRTNSTLGRNVSADCITSFDSDGFSLGSNANVNDNSDQFVAYSWLVNGGTSSTNNDGTSSSTVEVNTKNKISMFTYSGTGSAGATVGHGLGVTPDMFFMMDRYNGGGWRVWHKGLTSSSYYLEWNNNSAEANSSGAWNDTAPTSSVITLGSDTPPNGSGRQFISWAFASVAGFSSFDSYTGNGSTTGPVVNTGFEPAFLIVRRIDSGDNWILIDNNRSTSNPRANAIFPNLDSEQLSSGFDTDFLTNGFQIKTTDNSMNNNGGTYIYMAFAADASSAPTLANSYATNLYTGTGSPQSITGVGFSPSLVWLKSRDQVNLNVLTDVVRGSNKQLFSNSTDAQSTSTDRITSFDSDGFTLNSGGTFNRTNNNGTTYAVWNWKANSLPTINTAGTIQSVVSANQAAGFSIVVWTGDGNASATVGHGLSSTPDFIMLKDLTDAGSWNGAQVGLASNEGIGFNSSAAAFTSMGSNGGITYANLSATNFGFATGSSGVDSVNKNGNQYVAYCWKSVAGFSSIGSYTGVSSGVTITTGFEPSFIMVKSSSNVENWAILDTARGSGKALNPNLDAAESDSALNTFTVSATGFSFPDQSIADAMLNENGYEYIYMAYKENPGTPAAIPAGEVAYLVIAAGGGAGGVGGGGGAGGLRTSYGNYTGGGQSAESNITLSAQTYTITIGAGGTASATGGAFNNDGNTGSNGTSSVFGTITSLGGGGGTGGGNTALSGGSGGGCRSGSPGSGTYGQGFDGATGDIGGGGGGAAGTGLSSTAGSCGANGGPGLNVPITGTTTYYAGGGAGGVSFASGCSASSGGIGGGGDAGANAGTANTGGGGGGGSWTNNANYTTQGGGNGGSGVVILRMNTSDYSGTTTGSPTVTTDGSETILTYTGSGTYVHS